MVCTKKNWRPLAKLVTALICFASLSAANQKSRALEYPRQCLYRGCHIFTIRESETFLSKNIDIHGSQHVIDSCSEANRSFIIDSAYGLAFCSESTLFRYPEVLCVSSKLSKIVIGGAADTVIIPFGVLQDSSLDMFMILLDNKSPEIIVEGIDTSASLSGKKIYFITKGKRNYDTLFRRMGAVVK